MNHDEAAKAGALTAEALTDGRPTSDERSATQGSGPPDSNLLHQNRVLRSIAAELRSRIAVMSRHLQLGDRDSLTGLGNLRYFQRRLIEELDRAERDARQPFSILLLDVLGLASINEHSGREAGDQTLRWVARFLEEHSRRYDVCCRTVGGEFLLLLTGTDPALCAGIVGRLRRALATENSKQQIPVFMAVGRASFQRGCMASSRLILQKARSSLGLDRKTQRTAAARLLVQPDLRGPTVGVAAG